MLHCFRTCAHQNQIFVLKLWYPLINLDDIKFMIGVVRKVKKTNNYLQYDQNHRHPPTGSGQMIERQRFHIVQ